MTASSIQPSAWQQGSRIRLRGRTWRVEGVTAGVECSALRLREIEREPSRAVTLLAPFDRPVALERSSHPRRVRPRRWLHEVERAMVDIRPFGGLAATARSATRLLSYQLEPALAMLRHGATRVLVADAVGLGKTIEAGIVLLELAARSDAFRAIVIVPAGLRNQWASELTAHFGLTAMQADASWLRRAALELPSDVNPWSLPGIYIASHDFVKRPEALRPIEHVTWDLVVVDEAHAATSATDRRAALHALACRSRRVLLLTATPNAGDEREFRSLCDIGRIHRAEPNMLLFARSRADVDAQRPRKSLVVPIRPSAAEQQMHRLLERYSRQVWKEAGARGDDRGRLVSIVLRKRALSSAGSLLSSVARRLELLAGANPGDAQQLTLPLDDEDPLQDDEPQGTLAAPGLDDPVRERRWLSAIAEAARTAARAETKGCALVRLLRRVREPAIVFTEYRDTLTSIARRLAATRRPLVFLHGGLSPSERARATETFNRGGHTLLATDAAAEGLNLHHHCRLVIHYELPWNPARLEQRAGRVDRLGQARRVHEIALVASDTAERLVIAPLAARAAQSRAAPGASPLLDALSESDVAQAVMEEASVRMPRALTGASSQLAETMSLRDEAREEADRLTRERRWRARSDRVRGRRDGRLPVVSTTRRLESVKAGSIYIYLLAIEDNDGRPCHGEPLTLHVTSDATDARIAGLVEQRADEMRTKASTRDAHVRATSAARHAAIQTIRASAAQALVQQDLFDRRIARRPSSPDTELPFTSADATAPSWHTITSLLAVLHVTGSGPPRASVRAREWKTVRLR